MGFGGLRGHGEILALAPRLPDGLTRLSFSVLRGELCLRVDATTHEARYTLTRGAGPLSITHHGEPLQVMAAAPVVRPIPAAAAREPPTQPPGREPRRRSPGGV
jgi:alpha,alpha-trehalose phosphorylase